MHRKIDVYKLMDSRKIDEYEMTDAQKKKTGCVRADEFTENS